MFEIFGRSLGFADFVLVLTLSLVGSYIFIISNDDTFANAIAEERWGVIFGVFALHLVILSVWMMW